MPSTNTFYQRGFLPTLYFSKLKSRSKPSTTSEIHRKILNESRTDYGYTNSHRAVNLLANEKLIYEVKPDPSYIYVQDPKLREIFLLLIKSESQRIANDISPNILTQVDHFEYSLLLSKTGSIPIDNISSKQVVRFNLNSNLLIII